MYQIPLWVYMAIMAAGTAAQAKGAAKADKERAKAMAEERTRRGKLTAENVAAAEKSKQLFANVRQDEQARAAQIAQQIAPTKSQSQPAGGQVRMLDPTSPPSASSTVEDVNKSLAASDAAGSAYANAQAKAGAFGSVLGDYTRSLFGNAQDIDMNSTSMRNWAQNVLPARMEYANQSGREWNTAGDVLKLVGTIMAPMAMGGGAANAGTATQQIGAARFGDAARLAQGFGAGGSIPFGSSFGMDALASAGSMGAGIMADPRTQELLNLQRLGHRLSLEDLEYLKTHNNPGMLH